jgi:hypothetical protein
MAILNYTTTIDSVKTIAEIQSILSKHGACSITTDYVDELPVSVSFTIKLNNELLNFRLPSNPSGVYAVIQKDPKVPRRLKTKEQAQRVAWRITKNWVEAQMALVQAGLAQLPEVFLPYIINFDGQTLYKVLESKGFKSLTGQLN